MSRQKITVPAAGKEKRIPMTGLAVIIEFGNLYKNPDHVPSLAFNSGTKVKPMYPRSTYNFNGKKIDSIVIKGTAESEGDIFYLLTSENCLEEVIRVAFSQSYKSIPGTTFIQSATDTAKSLNIGQLIDSAGNKPSVVYVSVAPSATNSGIKWATNADPDQGDDTIGGLLKPGDTIPIRDINWILAFRYVSADNGDNQIVNFTPEY